MRSTNASINDRKLPTLAAVLEDYPEAVVVKYEPERRCTIRIEHNARTFYVKVFPPKFGRHGRGQRIHQIESVVWQMASDGRLCFRVARPIGWEPFTKTLWQEEIKGTPVLEKLQSDCGQEIAFRIGSAIASIERCRIKIAKVFDYSEQLKDSEEWAEKLYGRFPELSTGVDKLLLNLHAVDVFEGELFPIHGDMHVGQWLIDGKDLGLLDFEDFSLGHPERDLAFFAVQLESEHGAELPYADLNAQFLNGYRSQGREPNAKLLDIYSARKWFSKASKAATSERANYLLKRAFQCIDKTTDAYCINR